MKPRKPKRLTRRHKVAHDNKESGEQHNLSDQSDHHPALGTKDRQNSLMLAEIFQSERHENEDDGTAMHSVSSKSMSSKASSCDSYAGDSHSVGGHNTRAELTKDARTKFSLGLVYLKTGKHKKAKDYFRRALQARSALLGPNHPDVAAAHEMLGNVFSQMGDVDFAEKHYDLALKSLENFDDHMDNLEQHHKATASSLAASRLVGLPRHLQQSLKQESASSSTANTLAMFHRITARKIALHPSNVDIKAKSDVTGGTVSESSQDSKVSIASSVRSTGKPPVTEIIVGGKSERTQPCADADLSMLERPEQNLEKKTTMLHRSNSSSMPDLQVYGSVRKRAKESRQLNLDQTESRAALRRVKEESKSQKKRRPTVDNSHGRSTENQPMLHRSHSRSMPDFDVYSFVSKQQEPAPHDQKLAERRSTVHHRNIRPKMNRSDSVGKLHLSLCGTKRPERRRGLNEPCDFESSLPAIPGDEKCVLVDLPKGNQLVTVLDTANELYESGEYKRAKSLFASYLDTLQREAGGQSTVNVGLTYEKIGDCEVKLPGNNDKARECYQSSLRILRHYFHGDNEHVARVLNSCGGTFLETGDESLALEHYEEALSMRREVFGEQHETTVQTAWNAIRVHEILMTLALEKDGKEDYRAALHSSTEILQMLDQVCVHDSDIATEEHILRVSKQLVMNGHLHSELGEYDLALESLTAAIKQVDRMGISPVSDGSNGFGQRKKRILATAHHLSGFVYERKNEHVLAAESYANALPLIRDAYENSKQALEADVLLRMGFIQAEDGRNDEAMASFQDCLHLLKDSCLSISYNDYISVLDAMSKLHVNKNELDGGGAIQCKKEKLRMTEQFIGSENRVVAQTLQEIGLLQMQLHKHAIAAQFLERALKVEAKLSSYTDKEMCEINLSLARAYEATGEYQKAIEKYKVVLDTGTAEPHLKSKIFNGIGLALCKQGNPIVAVGFFKKSLQVCKEDKHNRSVAMNNLGRAFSQNGEFDRAQTCFDHVLRLNETKGQQHPDNLRVLLNKGLLFYQQKDYGQAESCLKDIIDRLGGEASESFCSAHRILGDICYEQKRYKDAIHHYISWQRANESVAVEGLEDIGSMVNLGTCYLHIGSFDDAIEIFESATRELECCNKAGDLDIAFIWDKIGRALSKKGDMQAAIKYFSLAYKRKSEILGENDLQVLKSRQGIGLILCKVGEHEQVYNISKGGSLEMEGDFEGGLEILQDVHQRMVSILGAGHVHVAKIRIDLSGAYFKNGDFKRAIELCSSARDACFSSGLSLGHPYFKQLDRLESKIEREGRGASFLFPWSPSSPFCDPFGRNVSEHSL